MKKNYVKASLRVYKVEPCVPLAASPEVQGDSESLGEEENFNWTSQQDMLLDQDDKVVEIK